MQENQITVTVAGANRVELVKRLRAFADNLDGTPAGTDGKVAKTTKKSAKAESFDDDTTTEGEQTEMDFDSEVTEGEEGFETAASDDADEDFTTPPKKETKKAKKITVAEVNEACKARAKAGGKDGRAHVLKILKKHFKTESISDIKPELYGKVIEAMQVTQ